MRAFEKVWFLPNTFLMDEENGRKQLYQDASQNRDGMYFLKIGRKHKGAGVFPQKGEDLLKLLQDPGNASLKNTLVNIDIYFYIVHFEVQRSVQNLSLIHGAKYDIRKF